MFLSLEKVKKHLNIDEYFHDDDEYLNHLTLVAEKVVEKHIDCDFGVLMDDLGNLPSPILHAMLLFIGDMYQSRESVSFASAQELPLSFRYLLDLYIDYSGDESRKPDRNLPKPQLKLDPSCQKPDPNPQHPYKDFPAKHVEVKNIEVL